MRLVALQVLEAILSSCDPKNNEGYMKEVRVYQKSLFVRKPLFGVVNEFRHKPGCAATEDGYMFEISDLEGRGIVLIQCAVRNINRYANYKLGSL